MSKRIKQTDIIGERGITLIHDIVLEMGFLWTPTGLEAGIDGYIEARDPKTSIVTNNVIQVQRKATDKEFIAETDSGFDFYCEPQDLDYWLGGNAPVILIRSRPSTHEAYWVPIKDYFKDLSTRQTHKIHFDKEKDRFDIKCRAAPFELARPKDSGLYLSPLPKPETLYSNLLQVTTLVDKLYIAETDYRSVSALCCAAIQVLYVIRNLAMSDCNDSRLGQPRLVLEGLWREMRPQNYSSLYEYALSTTASSSASYCKTLPSGVRPT